MKLARLLFKPKWQDRDADVRAAAVAGDADPELVAALPELARTDPDPRVRLAALKRLGDYERWRERSTGDADASVRRIARDTYLALLCTGGARRPPLARVTKELETLSPAEIETVAAQADAAELRRAALGYVARPALLAERATSDPDAALRLLALARIDEPALLERIAERTRKTDKTVSRAARERLTAARLGARDAAAIAERAGALCARLDGLLRTPESIEAVRPAVEDEWRKLGDDVPAHLVARFRGALALLDRHARRPLAVEERTVEPVAAAETEPAAGSGDRPSAAETPALAPNDQEQIAATLASKARFEAAVAAAREQAARDREQRDARLTECAALADRFGSAVEAGDTAAAHAAHARIAAIEEELGSLSPALTGRLEPLRARYAELRRWQHWSNQRRRRALCDEIEQLAATRAHPDAIAARVRDARVEWQQLDAHEFDASGASPLARRFHAVCQRALKPAAGYFEKRAAVRSARAREIEALLARAAAVCGDDAAISKALASARHELSTALRALDDVDPHERSGLARRIKEAIGAIAGRLQAHADAVAKAKARLIAQAAGLDPGDRSAPRTVRELQQQWTALGEGERAADQRQWREFRAACDRLFASLDAERKHAETAAAEQNARAQALVDEAAALLAGDAGSEALAARRRELETQWRALGSPDRALQQRFDQALARIAERASQLARAARLRRFSAALEHYRALRAGAPSAAAATTAGDGLAAEFAAAFAAQRDEASGGSAATIDAARDLLVRLEFLAGMASPDEDRERRMGFQIAQLSARMRGGDRRNAEQELAALMSAWFALPRVPDGLHERFERAAAATLATLP